MSKFEPCSGTLYAFCLNMHGRRHHYGHYGQCPYKFQDPPKLVRNVRTSLRDYEKEKIEETLIVSRNNYEK